MVVPGAEANSRNQLGVRVLKEGVGESEVEGVR